MSTLLLLIILVCLIVCSYRYMRHDLVNPTILLALPLVAAVSGGLLYYEQWQFNLQWSTVLLVGGSVLFFFLGNLLPYALLHVRYKRAQLSNKQTALVGSPHLSQGPQVQNPAWEKVNHAVMGKKFQLIFFSLLLIFQISVYALVYRHILSVVSSYHGKVMSDRTSAIGVYDQLVKFSNVNTALPSWLRACTLFCGTIGLPLVYLLVSQMIRSKDRFITQVKKNPQFLIIMLNLIPSACGNLITGGKAGTVWFILSALVVGYLVVANVRGQRQRSITWKLVFRIVALLAGLVILTLLLVFVVGRNMKDYHNGPLGYLLIYLSGGMKNLDIYVSSVHPMSGHWGIQTFKSLYRFFDISIPDVGLETYHHVGKAWFGNVYTAFADPYYDFGIAGTLLAMLILGILFGYIFIHTYTQVSFNTNQSASHQLNGADAQSIKTQWRDQSHLAEANTSRTTVFAILVYGYLIRALFFAFFSNILFTSIFSVGFVFRCGIWLVFVLLFIPRRGDDLARDALSE